MQYTFLLALWFLIGIINIFVPGGITLINYFCVWAMLILTLASMAIPEILSKLKKK